MRLISADSMCKKYSYRFENNQIEKNMYISYQKIILWNFSRNQKLTKTETPLFIAIAGKDVLVDNHATYKAIRSLPDAKRFDMPDSRHEILMEKNKIREKFLKNCFESWRKPI